VSWAFRKKVCLRKREKHSMASKFPPSNGKACVQTSLKDPSVLPPHSISPHVLDHATVVVEDAAADIKDNKGVSYIELLWEQHGSELKALERLPAGGHHGGLSEYVELDA